MPLPLALLVVLLVLAASTAAFAYQTSRERRQILSRVDGRLATAGPSVFRIETKADWKARVAEWLARRTPESWSEGAASDKLVHAGYDGPSAPAVFTLARLASAVAFPLLAFTFAPRTQPAMFVTWMVLGLAIGIFGPQAFLNHKVGERQGRIRRAMPDSLDLLVVCVEAGVSLDAAILRVAREMEILHPDLSSELLIVNRKVNAGITREAALHGLWTRTGVEELRGLAASMIQSERWGTSISTVLRVYAETLRRKRKQAAEKKAAELPVKMLIPIAIFIFPTLFVVILGPAAIRVFAMLKPVITR
ncbi:MAG TPA: type II secretion system F family protein [Gemmatimonadaceae bacterium]|nr:type II secretion system F family protein [Gemmatimonadaceae bacterium]